MKSLPRWRRVRRGSQFNLECLDERVMPSTMHAAIGGSAEALAETSAARRHEINMVRRHETHMAGHAWKHEKAVERRELRLARREARYLARHPSAMPPTTPPSQPGPLPANVGAPLQSLYTQYEAYANSGASGPFRPTGINGLVISGTSVGVQVKANSTADFNAMLAELQSAGMQVGASSSTYGLVNGMLPIAQLPTVAQLPQTLSVMPMFNPILSSSPLRD